MSKAVHVGTKRTVAGIAAAIAIVFALSCGSASVDRGPVSSARQGVVYKTDLIVDGPDVLNVGDSAQYTATAVFSDGTRVDFTLGVVWITSDRTIATIGNFDQAGIGTGVSPGQVTFTALADDVSGSKMVTVQ